MKNNEWAQSLDDEALDRYAENIRRGMSALASGAKEAVLAEAERRASQSEVQS